MSEADLEEIQGLDDTSSMLKSVTYKDWPTLRFIGEQIAEYGLDVMHQFKSLLATDCIIFGQKVNDKNFSTVRSPTLPHFFLQSAPFDS